MGAARTRGSSDEFCISSTSAVDPYQIRRRSFILSFYDFHLAARRQSFRPHAASSAALIRHAMHSLAKKRGVVAMAAVAVVAKLIRQLEGAKMAKVNVREFALLPLDHHSDSDPRSGRLSFPCCRRMRSPCRPCAQDP